MPRSLRVRPRYLTHVKATLLRNGFPSQKLLAEALGISQSTVSNFLNGKPVDYANFVEICQVLSQEWRDLADLGEPIEETVIPAAPVSQRIFLRQFESQPLSQPLPTLLRQAGHTVLVADAQMPPGHALAQCDVWLLLLSNPTAHSEILLAELQSALELHQGTPQKPAIFPIWLAEGMEAPNGDLLPYLEGIPLWRWSGDREAAKLTAELLPLLSEGRTSLPLEHPLTFIPAQRCQSTPALEANTAPLELPTGQVRLDSPFYLPRPPIEERCLQAIGQPGALIRIKAPRQMGKTSLLARILHQAAHQGSRVMNLNLQLGNKRVFASTDTFLQWFCASLALELGQVEQIAPCWSLVDLIGSNQCCRLYLEQHLLADPAPPLTLGIDELDRVFEFPEIAEDFLGLLRSLHEEAKRRPLWQKLRLVIVHSTEVYLPLDINKSPFNVGLPVELPEFTAAQIQTLAQRHGLEADSTLIGQLMALIGGHPYLARLTLYHLAQGLTTLPELLQSAASDTGIYGEHLRRHWWNLEKYPDLVAGMKQVVSSDRPVPLRAEVAFRLQGMGLIHLMGNEAQIRCQLYLQYLRDRL